jgi:hypothetical protein
VVVTSHGCVCEKYERALAKGRPEVARKVFVQVAPLENAEAFPRDQLPTIEKGGMRDLFYLEGSGLDLKHKVTILTREQAVPAEVLVEKCKRVAQVADWQWAALRLHLTLTRFRKPADKIFRDELLKGGDQDGD